MTKLRPLLLLLYLAATRCNPEPHLRPDLKAAAGKADLPDDNGAAGLTPRLAGLQMPVHYTRVRGPGWNPSNKVPPPPVPVVFTSLKASPMEAQCFEWEDPSVPDVALSEYMGEREEADVVRGAPPMLSSTLVPEMEDAVAATVATTATTTAGENYKPTQEEIQLRVNEQRLMALEEQLFMDPANRSVPEALTGLFELAAAVPPLVPRASAATPKVLLSTGYWTAPGRAAVQGVAHPEAMRALTRIWYPIHEGSDGPLPAEDLAPSPNKPPLPLAEPGAHIKPFRDFFHDQAIYVQFDRRLRLRRTSLQTANAPRWGAGGQERLWAGIGEVFTPLEGNFAAVPPAQAAGASALYLLAVIAYSGVVDDANFTAIRTQVAGLGLTRVQPTAEPKTAILPPDERTAGAKVALTPDATCGQGEGEEGEALHLPTQEWAVHALQQAARAGSLEAVAAVGALAVTGKGMRQSCEAGVWHLWAVADHVLSVAEEGADYALPREPIRLRDRERDGSFISDVHMEDSEDQVTMEQDLAQRGSTEAERHLGYRRLVGRGLEEDADTAFEHFQAATAAGDHYAAFNLGFMYLRGLGVQQNFTQARVLFDTAVASELPSAFNGLGVLHFNGWGVPQNFTKAKLLFEEAASRNDPDAHYNVATIHHGAHGVPKDMTKAMKSYEAASDAGHWRAPYTLATLHARGQGTKVDCSKAARLFRLFIEERSGWSLEMDNAIMSLDEGDELGALIRYLILAMQGSEAAMSNVGYMLRKGLGYSGEGRADKALHWILQSGFHGSPDAYVDAGNMYFKGDKEGLTNGTQLEESVEMYRKAHEAGMLEGSFNLAWMHEVGQGVQRNLTYAKELYSKGYELASTDSEAFLFAVALGLSYVRECLSNAILWRPFPKVWFKWLHVPLINKLHPMEQEEAAVSTLSVLVEEGSGTQGSWNVWGGDWDTWGIVLMAGLLAGVLHRRGLLTQQQPPQTLEEEPVPGAIPAPDTHPAGELREPEGAR